jgi:hypothetical protein
MEGVHVEIFRFFVLFHTVLLRRFSTVSEASTPKTAMLLDRAEPNFPLSRAFFLFFFFLFYTPAA